MQAARADLLAHLALGATAPVAPPKPIPALESVGPDPDRWNWPNGPAMNRAEVQTLTQRLMLFEVRGLTVTDAERLADRLTQRDRQGDTRGVCAECRHLTGAGASLWRCSDRSKTNDLAGLALAAVFVHGALHRCPSRKPP